VWGRVCSLLAGDCKKALAAVKAVALKYRMTNKPAPEAPSPYVEGILQPFRYTYLISYLVITHLVIGWGLGLDLGS
jgi:Domain of unknown function (DUF3510)